jgi:hypothetical protein
MRRLLCKTDRTWQKSKASSTVVMHGGMKDTHMTLYQGTGNHGMKGWENHSGAARYSRRFSKVLS